MKEVNLLKKLVCFGWILFPLYMAGQGITNSGGYIVNSGSAYIVITNGGINNTGSWTKSTETILFTGSVAGELKGNATGYHNLEVSNTAGITLNTSSITSCNDLLIDNNGIFTIPATGKLTVSGTLTNNSSASGLNIKSTASGNGSLIHSSAAVNATVEQLLQDPALTYYHIISSPVSDATAAVLKFSGAGPFLYEYVNSGTPSRWYNIIPSSTALTANKGYLISFQYTSIDRTVTYSGPLNTGTATFSVSSGGDGYNLVGNPYPCAIDWDVNDGFGWTRNNTGTTIYIWNPATGSYGAYVKGTGGTGTNQVSNIIGSGQGFFVHTTGTPDFQVASGAKTHNNSIIKAGLELPSLFRVKLTASADSTSDESIFRFVQGATNKSDLNLEAVKFFSMSSKVSEIYSLTADSIKLSINALPLEWKDSIPLFFKCRQAGQYQLQVNLNTFSDSIMLTDLLKDSTLDIAHHPYTFDGTPNDAESRFLINKKTKSGSALGTLKQKSLPDIIIFTSGNTLHIRNNSNASMDGMLAIYDITGKSVFSDRISFSSEYIKNIAEVGVFVVKFMKNNEMHVKKVVVY